MTTWRGAASALCKVYLRLSRCSRVRYIRPFDNVDAGYRFFARLFLHGDAPGGVGGVGNETSLSRMDGLDQTFASEGITFEDVERSGIKGQAAAVGDPVASRTAKQTRSRRTPFRLCQMNAGRRFHEGVN